MREAAKEMNHDEPGTEASRAKNEAWAAADKEEARINEILSYEEQVVGGLSAALPLMVTYLWVQSRESIFLDIIQRAKDQLASVERGGRLLSPEGYVSIFTRLLTGTWYSPAAPTILGVANEFNTALKRALEHFLTPGVDIVGVYPCHPALPFPPLLSAPNKQLFATSPCRPRQPLLSCPSSTTSCALSPPPRRWLTPLPACSASWARLRSHCVRSLPP
jgi:hypothetical protein